MENLRFSVITTTWDRLNLLRDNVESLQSQGYKNYEHIFVDGGSTDGTLEWLSTVPGEVRVLHNVRGGIARAMNAGLKAAAGDIILHLHSDDYLPHARVLANVAATFSRTGCEWMYGRSLTDLNGGWSPEANHFPQYSYSRLIQGDIIPHPATYVRRRLFDRAGLFDESIKYAMDYDMWLRLGKLAEPLQVREFLSVFRAHDQSATYANRLASAQDEYLVRKRYLSGNPLQQLNYLARYLKRRRALQREIARQQIRRSS